MCVGLSGFSVGVVTIKRVQGFAGADGGQGVLIVELVVKLRRGGGGVGFDLSL